MTPSFFGPSARSLFGIYHPPVGRPARNRGVLLCAPLGQEAIRAHRALRQLAILLSRARYHVLRFDYYGCGDSAGDSSEGHTTQWLEDIATATAELKDCAGVNRVCWVGLRYGASLAVLAARGRRDLDSLVLWDPVVDGKAYLREVCAMHEQLLLEELGDRRRHRRATSPDDAEEILGFPLPRRLRDEIRQLDLLSIVDYPVRRVALVVSSTTPAYDRLRAHLSSLRLDMTYAHVPAEWNSDQVMNRSLVPMDLLQTIVASLAEAAA
ncbi:MAG: alpha/beta fold hydrolase [Myxococcales bacterium]|nr:alpha/beta fold hydrolase [Myxococcota bacterium]MDW8284053.1 alpha/beta fold hydrolase [Myxococcales bacterium]